ncbi:ABC transporter ATP-binding protein, partial [Methylobacterium tarhaniae]
QMLAIGRALMARPKLLLLDEPSLGLAPRLAEEVYERVGRIRASGLTILVVEQNTVLALAVADRGYVLETGRVVLAGPAAELRSNPRVREAYLGR